MLDIKYIIENFDNVKEKLSARNGSFDLDRLKQLDLSRRAIIREVENLKSRRNAVTKEIEILKRAKGNADALINDMKNIGLEIKDLDARLTKVQTELDDIMYSIPNLTDDSVPLGKTDSENVEIRRFLQPKNFEFMPKPHWEIGENLNILDFQRAAKITGARFTVYKGLGAKLERALINFMLDTHTASGYTEVFTPFMVNASSMTGTGQLPKFEEDMFAIKNMPYYLIPTAEVSVTNLHRGEILSEDSLNISYCAYSACFRAEAGSAGRDTRGIIRQHQFNKVELVKFTKPSDSFLEHEKLTADAEKILQLLELPHRTVLLCSGDTGFSSAKTYDIEVYMPSYEKYVEISSCSNFLDFQARRANIKYRAASGKAEFVHTLNGSGLAIGRTVAAILENYQNSDGTVTVPKVLIPYMSTNLIK